MASGDYSTDEMRERIEARIEQRVSLRCSIDFVCVGWVSPTGSKQRTLRAEGRLSKERPRESSILQTVGNEVRLAGLISKTFCPEVSPRRPRLSSSLTTCKTGFVLAHAIGASILQTHNERLLACGTVSSGNLCLIVLCDKRFL